MPGDRRERVSRRTLRGAGLGLAGLAGLGPAGYLHQQFQPGLAARLEGQGALRPDEGWPCQYFSAAGANLADLDIDVLADLARIVGHLDRYHANLATVGEDNDVSVDDAAIAAAVVLPALSVLAAVIVLPAVIVLTVIAFPVVMASAVSVSRVLAPTPATPMFALVVPAPAGLVLVVAVVVVAATPARNWP